jgi:poly-gamma-glutamate capsule biosynthesis protein CapA/YwtB (metallophosphatase superfamily)
MDQNTIIDALQKALSKGSGSLDDLDSLLSSAKADIAAAKEEEKKQKEAAAKKRGEDIAALANRLLEDEITDDDCAYVMNAWLRTHGIKRAAFTGKDLKDIMTASQNSAVESFINEDLSKLLDECANSIHNWLQDLDKETNKKPAPQPKKDPSADDVINDFLKSFGLR